MKIIATLVLAWCVGSPLVFASGNAGPIKTPEAKALLSQGLALQESSIEFFKLAGWYMRYEKIGRYDKSLYNLSDPGLAPEGVVVLTSDRFFFAVWDKEKKSYRSFFDFPISDVAEATLLEKDLVLTIKRKDGHFHVFQAGGSRVDKAAHREILRLLTGKVKPDQPAKSTGTP